MVLIVAAGPAAAQTGPVPRFVGLVDQDGCAGCCEFGCQLTPTPTPEVDGQGRRVFRHDTGTFLFVAEAGPGSSGRQAGSEGVYSGSTIQPILHSSGRPSLQVISANNLGNGSLKIDCPLGGVKGFPNGLSFPPDQDVTTALIDMACRFEMISSGTGACTRDAFGAFAFMNHATTRQYCFQIPPPAQFPVGDTPVAVQFRDTAGNLGPRQEIVIRVAPGLGQAASPTPTPTRTRTPIIANISGHIRYYSAADRPVAAASVQLSGTALQNTPTSSTGDYMFSNLMPGNATVEPRKVGDFGSPNAITALDASWILQVVAGIRAFDSNQRLACDVTGNGTISALDATRILQRQVGLLPRLAVADLCNSDWVFRPVPGPAVNQRLIDAQISTGMCRRGAIALEPLVGNVTQQDFAGILFGDCTGNWQPASPGPAFRALAPAPHTLRVRSARPAGSDGGLRLPMAVKGEDPYYSLDVTIAYDSEHLRPIAVRKLRAAGDALVISNLAGPGVVRIAVASAATMPSGISIIAVDFEGTGTGADVNVIQAMIDDLPAPLVE